MDNQVADIVIFLGRFHPLVVHLPIGFLLLAGLFEWMGRKEKYTSLKEAATFTLLLGAISSVAAAALGYLLSLGGGYNESTLDWHMWMGIFVCVVSIVAYLYKANIIPTFSRLPQTAYMGVMVIMLGSLGYTGHLGGSLTHGSTYLTQYMPNGMRALAGLPPRETFERQLVTNLDSAEIFADVIQPVLEARCVSCHNENKKKGDLLMTDFAMLMEGGEHGEVIMAGNAIKSELVRRVTLPKDDEKFMPPEGKIPLNDDQIAILNWWIEQGAPEKDLIHTLVVTEDIRPALERELGLDAASARENMLAGANVSPVDPTVMDNLKAQGFKVYQIAQESPFLDVDFSLSDTTLSDNQIKALLKAQDQILWLTLSKKEVQDDHLEIIGQLPNLMRLRLDQTSITDEGMKHLTSLKKLEYLNLYGTNVSDASLESLKTISSLKSLYLWQTNVSEAAVEDLAAANPELMIDTGFQFSKTANEQPGE